MQPLKKNQKLSAMGILAMQLEGLEKNKKHVAV
jgi:hypothetical protein